MKPYARHGREPHEPGEDLTRLAYLSRKLRRLSGALEDGVTVPAFASADNDAARERDISDRAGMAGRDVMVREADAFELNGRTRETWLHEIERLFGGASLAVLGLKHAGDRISIPADPHALYAVVIVRLDRAGRKLAKLLIPRQPQDGPLPIDEAGAMAWAMIPHVEFWGTRCDRGPANPVSVAGSQQTKGKR